jgi:cytochrome c553
MRSISLILKQFSRSVLLIAGLAVMGVAAYAQGDAAKGEALFKAKCTACHKMDVRMTGPALGPTIQSETDDKWLTKWIRNNQALIAAKDPKAIKVFNEYNQANMTVFEDLSEGDVANIIAYARAWKPEVKPVGGPGAPAAESAPSTMMILGLIAVIIVAFIIILVLNRVVGTLERLLLKKNGLLTEESGAVEVAKADPMAKVKQLAKNKKFVFFVVVCAVIALSTWQFEVLWNTNVHQGYQPVQPIKYSHELHAGVMKIDCQYCHSGAYKSKNASIPSLNVCMNCHKAVKTESPEIHKIYDALGYDPATTKYDSTKAKPIQWVRVHNLPDLAYFNHSQHVKVGKIICQTCHGPVQTMKEVYQYAPLTMKWCIQCHKRTDVNFKGNDYYTRMVAVHDMIKKGEKMTAAAMGGIECGKCHY